MHMEPPKAKSIPIRKMKVLRASKNIPAPSSDGTKLGFRIQLNNGEENTEGKASVRVTTSAFHKPRGKFRGATNALGPCGRSASQAPLTTSASLETHLAFSELTSRPVKHPITQGPATFGKRTLS